MERRGSGKKEKRPEDLLAHVRLLALAGSSGAHGKGPLLWHPVHAVHREHFRFVTTQGGWLAHPTWVASF